MQVPSYDYYASFRRLLIMCLTLLLMPNAVAIASLCFLSQLGAAVVLANLLSFGLSLEMIIVALLAVGIGMAAYLAVAVLSTERPTLADVVAIELSQAFSFLLSIAALVHNPQEEFCRANPSGSALAEAFQLDSCSLTVDFWMQAGVGGLVIAASFVLILRIGRSIIRTIFN